MNKVKAPYSINKLTTKVALDAFNNLDVFKNHLDAVMTEKLKLEVALGALPCVQRVLNSETNFIMFVVEHAEEVYKKMADKGIVVRYRGNCLHCGGCLRVTVGTSEENEKFLAMLKDIATEVASR